MLALRTGIVAHDHQLATRIRGLLLAAIPLIEVLEPLEAAHDPQVIVLASSAEQPSLVEAVRMVRSVTADAPIVVVAPESGTPTGRAVLEAGTAGLVIESAIESALAPTLFAVVAGQVCLPRELAAELERPLLSMREKQVLGMVVLGFGNADIAGRLVLAESTIKSHLNSAYRKLGVRSRQEAAAAILDPVRGLGSGILTIDTDARPPAPPTSQA